MSIIYNIIFFIVCSFLNDGRAQKITPLPFPHLIDFKESDIGKPYFTFEGVDYDLIPKRIYKRDFMNCYEEFARCTRFLLYASPVCGYDSYYRGLKPYYSLCELDLASCKVMKIRGVPMHGTSYRNRGVFFLGEGNNCELYLRRIAEGLVPRDIRESQEDETQLTTTMTKNYDVMTTAKDIKSDKTMYNYDYENIMY